MTLQGKLDYVLKYVRLGMDTYSAMIVAELTTEEIEDAEADKKFQGRVILAQKLEEMSLLETFDRIMGETAAENDSKDVKWKLKVLNARYGDNAARQASSGPDSKKKMNITISFDGTDATLENAENVEIYDPDDAPRAEV